MPSEKILEQKKQAVAALAESLKSACTGVIVDYKGITVAQDTKLRKELREAGSDYMVVKNTLLRLALKTPVSTVWTMFLRVQPHLQSVRTITFPAQRSWLNLLKPAKLLSSKPDLSTAVSSMPTESKNWRPCLPKRFWLQRHWAA